MKDEVMRISAKGQLTIPISFRKRLNLREGDYVRVSIEQNCIQLHKVQPPRPLSPEDPIWGMIGLGDSGLYDVSTNHDRYLAEGEAKRWDE
jgi:transcriptional pleiotropic regulator of transition state genes